MKVSEQIAIMKAYEDGKTIEGKDVKETDWKILEYVENYPFDFVANEYRIATDPKYRPYESVEEAFNEAEKHGFWIRNKEEWFLSFINIFDKTKDGNTYICDFLSYELLDKFVWHDDGSPCGVKIN